MFNFVTLISIIVVAKKQINVLIAA
jgi:hypothetical protein